MMREQLIQLLEYVKPNPDAQSEDYYQDLVTAVRELRCDKCKHWEAPAEEWMQGLGECTRLRDPKGGSLTMGANGGYLFTCPPDFFCAYWEAK